MIGFQHGDTARKIANQLRYPGILPRLKIARTSPLPKQQNDCSELYLFLTRFWRTLTYQFSFVLTNSKLLLFYQPKSNSPQRKPREVAVLPANVPTFKCPAKKNIISKRWRIWSCGQTSECPAKRKLFWRSDWWLRSHKYRGSSIVAHLSLRRL